MEKIMSNSLSMCFIYKPMGAILWKLFSSVGFASFVAQGLGIKEKFPFNADLSSGLLCLL